MGQRYRAVKKSYQLSDSDMLETAKLKLDLMIDYQADFENFDIEFADPFAADLQTLIADAEVTDTDETFMDQLSGLTGNIITLEKDMLKLFKGTRYFVEKAWPGSTGRMAAFGYFALSKARQSQLKTLMHFLVFNAMVQQEQAALTAAGMDAAMIADIDAKSQDLIDANMEQEIFRQTRYVLTENRTLLFNNIWSQIKRICKAGKIIFADDEEKYRLWLLPVGDDAREDIEPG